MGVSYVRTSNGHLSDQDIREVLEGQDDLLVSLGLGHSVVSLVLECFVNVS